MNQLVAIVLAAMCVIGAVYVEAGGSASASAAAGGASAAAAAAAAGGQGGHGGHGGYGGHGVHEVHHYPTTIHQTMEPRKKHSLGALFKRHKNRNQPQYVVSQPGYYPAQPQYYPQPYGAAPHY